MSYRCRSCGSSYPEVEAALNHVNTHSNLDKACVVPGCNYGKQKRLSKHTSRKHRSSCRYLCSVCKRVFVRDKDMRQHLRDKHGEGITREIRQHYPPTFGYRTTASASRTIPEINVPPFFGVDWARNYLSLGNHTAASRSSETSESRFSFDVKMTDGELNRFIDRRLQPDESFNMRMRSAVDNICTFLRNEMQPKEIIKGGSLGKGTAIKGHADIDLVLVLDEDKVGSAAELKRELPSIKCKIRSHLADATFPIVPNSIKETSFAVKFTINVDNEDIDIDLLPTFHFTDSNALYRRMVRGDEDLLDYNSVALVKLQVDFVKRLPPNVKNLIRLVKYWNKNYVRDNTSRSYQPTSYAMELITISVWEKGGRSSQFEILEAFRAVMERLRNVNSLDVVWETNYGEEMIPSNIRRQRPRLMDPANPTNNLYDTFKWNRVELAAQRACQSTLLEDVSSW